MENKTQLSLQNCLNIWTAYQHIVSVLRYWEVCIVLLKNITHMWGKRPLLKQHANQLCIRKHTEVLVWRSGKNVKIIFFKKRPVDYKETYWRKRPILYLLPSEMQNIKPQKSWCDLSICICDNSPFLYINTHTNTNLVQIVSISCIELSHKHLYL